MKLSTTIFIFILFSKRSVRVFNDMYGLRERWSVHVTKSIKSLRVLVKLGKSPSSWRWPSWIKLTWLKNLGCQKAYEFESTLIIPIIEGGLIKHVRNDWRWYQTSLRYEISVTKRSRKHMLISTLFSKTLFIATLFIESKHVFAHYCFIINLQAP